MAGPEITIEPADGAWSIRSQGAVLGESDRALILREGDLEPVVYFPRDDIQMAFFDVSDKTTHCPHKGDATYFHMVGRNRTEPNVAWSYEAPKKQVAQIKGYLAFYPNAVTVESVS